MRLRAIIALALLLGAGCAERLDLSTLPAEPVVVADTSYVPIFPPYPGYEGAQDIMIGNDQLLYVADTRANRVVMLNRAGQFMSSRTMLHPISLGQTTRLDLLVGGEMVAASGSQIEYRMPSRPEFKPQGIDPIARLEFVILRGTDQRPIDRKISIEPVHRYR